MKRKTKFLLMGITGFIFVILFISIFLLTYGGEHTDLYGFMVLLSLTSVMFSYVGYHEADMEEIVDKIVKLSEEPEKHD